MPQPCPASGRHSQHADDHEEGARRVPGGAAAAAAAAAAEADEFSLGLHYDRTLKLNPPLVRQVLQVWVSSPTPQIFVFYQQPNFAWFP